MLGEHVFDHRGASAGQLGVQVVGRCQRLLEVLVHDGLGRWPLEGDAPGHHVVERRAQ